VDPTRRLRPAAGVAVHLEDDEAFLLEIGSGRLRLLNATGVEVWHLLDGERDAAAVARELGRAHAEADPAAVARDVELFLDELEAARLVEVVVPHG
jgi:hypothetical protein